MAEEATLPEDPQEGREDNNISNLSDEESSDKEPEFNWRYLEAILTNFGVQIGHNPGSGQNPVTYVTTLWRFDMVTGHSVP